MAIPKVIHYCWFGDNDIPEESKRCISSWKKFCPDYEIKRWDETNFEYTRYMYAEEAYINKKWAFVADVARLDIVYQYGGFYLDTDVELIRPLDSMLNNCAFMGFEQGRHVATGLGFGAEKGNYLIKKNLEEYENLHFVNEDGTLNLTPCPQITTRVLERFGLYRRDEMQELYGLKVYPTEFFSPMLLSDGSAEITGNTMSIHYGAGSWLTDKEKREFQKRRMIYTKYGRKSLRIYDGYSLLKNDGWRAFFKRCKEIVFDR